MFVDNTVCILVVGATGFLGANLVRTLDDMGIESIAGFRTDSDQWRLGHRGADRVFFCNITAPLNDLAAAIKQSGVNIVVNCAAYGVDYRQSDFEIAVAVNIVGTHRLVCAAAQAGCTRFVHVGTSSEYGIHTGLINEQTILQPIGLYGITKASSTLVALGAGRMTGLPVVVVRPFGMYGPLEGMHKFVPMVMRAGFTGQYVDLTPGAQHRDYVYIEDVARGIAELCVRPDFPAGEIYNFSSGTPVTLRQLGEAALTASGAPQRLLRWGAKPYRPDEIMFTVGSGFKAEKVLGWRARTSLEEGMRITAAYYKPTVN